MGKLEKKNRRMMEKQDKLRTKEDELLDRVIALTNASVRDAKRNMGISQPHNYSNARKSTINAFMDCNDDNGTCKACRSRLFGR
jgi:hypothetical protein